MSNIPIGFKQTEIGVIPEDWRACTFEDVLTGFSSGMTPYRGRSEYYKGDIPWITSGELNYNIITDTEEKITKEAVIKTNLKILPKGTFLMAITGLEAEGTRGSCGIVGTEATTNQSCMALFPIKSEITTEFLYYYYVRYGDSLAFKYCQGTKQQSYTGRIAKILPINLPPTLAEQTAITNAIIDVDKLIQSTEKLITKKRNIKQVAMHELLKRKEGWVVKPLGEIGTFKNGINKSQNDFGFGYYFINLLDVFGKNELYWSNNYGLVNTSDLEQKTYNLKKGDILFVRSSVKPEGIGLTAVLQEDLPSFVYSGFLIRFRDNGILDLSFKKFCFNEGVFRRRLIEASTVSANTNINQDALKKLEISIPPLTEQTRIATILSDMDAEISALGKKLVKYKQIKQGMMQNLLTGRIRLV